jgi:hypothetical protein
LNPELRCRNTNTIQTMSLSDISKNGFVTVEMKLEVAAL